MCKQNINRDTKDLIDKQLSQRKANGNIQVEIMKRAKGVEQFIKPEGHEYLPDVELMYTTEENTLAVQKSKQANIEKKRKQLEKQKAASQKVLRTESLPDLKKGAPKKSVFQKFMTKKRQEESSPEQSTCSIICTSDPFAISSKEMKEEINAKIKERRTICDLPDRLNQQVLNRMMQIDYIQKAVKTGTKLCQSSQLRYSLQSLNLDLESQRIQVSKIKTHKMN